MHNEVLQYSQCERNGMYDRIKLLLYVRICTYFAITNPINPCKSLQSDFVLGFKKNIKSIYSLEETQEYNEK